MLNLSVRYIKIAFAASVALCVFTSVDCKSNPPKEETKKIEFNIDSTQIAPEVEMKDYNVSFSPPVNLIHSDELFNKLSASIQGTNQNQSGLATIPVDVFMDKSYNMLIVSSIKVENKDTTIDDLGNVVKAIKAQFVNDKNVKHAEFFKDNIKINQFLVQDSLNVIFKVLFTTPQKQVIQFDYIIPQNNYKNEIKAIESSIGSIKYIK